ncbi:HEAT repeat domain-containing protein [Candidatus Sumerlaeota bacterium]|nr:HEAT repeat domain-containing protein [Candidatus Sumerlaeota bacterium]
MSEEEHKEQSPSPEGESAPLDDIDTNPDFLDDAESPAELRDDLPDTELPFDDMPHIFEGAEGAELEEPSPLEIPAPTEKDDKSSLAMRDAFDTVAFESDADLLGDAEVSEETDGDISSGMERMQSALPSAEELMEEAGIAPSPKIAEKIKSAESDVSHSSEPQHAPKPDDALETGLEDEQEFPEHITANDIQDWLEKGDVDKVLASYPQIMQFSVRRQLIERLGAHCVQQQNVEPLLRLATMESEIASYKQIFHQIQHAGVENLPKDFNLADYKPNMRRALIIVFGQLQPRQVIPQLREQMHDNDLMIRASAIQALAQYGEKLDDLIPMLAGVLKKDSDPRAQFIAAKELADIGSMAAKDAMEAAIGYRQLHPKVKEQLEILRQKTAPKLKTPEKSKSKKSKQAARASSSSFGFDDKPKIQAAQIIKIVVVVALVIGALAFSYQRSKKYLHLMGFGGGGSGGREREMLERQTVVNPD